jgi:hypothetical protein
MAEDFLEKSIRSAFEMGGDADEPPIRIAPAEASRQARAPLDAAPRFEVGHVPEAKPPVQGFDQVRGKAGARRHGRRG